jgi:hypothetical protein
MKKLLFLSVVAAFACVSAVQAGEDCAAKAKAAACADKSKASDCSAGKDACCASAKKVTKKVDTSVKGASLLLVRK